MGKSIPDCGELPKFICMCFGALIPRASLRDGPFDNQGGWDFFEKKFVFLHEKKNKMSSTKLKIKTLFFIQ